MKTRLMILFCLLSILAVLPLWRASPASAGSVLSENKVPAGIESIVRRLTNNLRIGGYEVAIGYVRLYELEDCDISYKVMGTCFLNNPAAPYVLPVVPTWPDEWVDPATINALGETKPGTSGTYHLDPREALLILGKLPPESEYFGIQSYLFTRQGDYDRNSDMYKYMKQYYGQAMLDAFFHYVIENPNRIATFDSLSNANNDVVIAEQSGAAFNQLRYFIITPDQVMNARLRKALGKLAIAEKDIFTEPIPGNMRFGLNKEADDFTTLIRYAEPLDITLADQWRTELPLVVLRIRPVRPGWQPVPYDPVVLDERYALDEFPLQPDLLNLVAAVFERWGQAYDPGLIRVQHDFQTEFDFVGPLCEKIGMDCLGDSQDASYQASPAGFLLDIGKIFAYVGVLGTETGNSSYVGLGVNDGRRKLGVFNIRGKDLIGSANLFDDQVNNTELFFVHYFARSCAGLDDLTNGQCTEITPEMIPICTDPTGASCVRTIFTERDYIFPGSHRGPNSAFILPSRVVTLQDPRP